MATPHRVPTTTGPAAPGRIEIPNADGSVRLLTQLYPASGVLSRAVPSNSGSGYAVSGWLHVAPASALTLIPAIESTRPSYHDAAYTRSAFVGSTSTSQPIVGRCPSRWVQVTPASAERNRPPYSLAR